MHTRKMQIGPHTVVFNYNSDLSGDVLMRWSVKDSSKWTIGHDPEVEELEIPGFVFLAMMDFSKEELKNQLVYFLETGKAP